eukprot:jgi/Bigna1/126789/aug1.3_g1497
MQTTDIKRMQGHNRDMASRFPKSNPPRHPPFVYGVRRRGPSSREGGSSSRKDQKHFQREHNVNGEGKRPRLTRAHTQTKNIWLGPEVSHGSHDLDRQTQNWDDEFQSALETENWEKLHQISIDFVETATLYGKIVILEQFLPDSQRTIKVERVGGWAGGTKFIVRGIMFKLAEDAVLPAAPQGGNLSSSASIGPRYLYGGYGGPCHEFAAKSASHELKGANHMFRSRSGWLACTDDGMKPLTRPLARRCVMIDYCGFRVTARPWLTLPSGSMLYGYDARSRRMQSAIGFPDVRALLRECAKKLHLCEHLSFGEKIFTGGDVEVHKGERERLYIVDATRTFPCESSDMADHLIRRGQPEFFRLLRPELLQRLKAKGFPALNPDGFTGFSKGDPAVVKHMDDIERATESLIGEIIPEIARTLDRDDGKLRGVKILNIIIGNDEAASPELWSRVYNDLISRFGDVAVAPVPGRGLSRQVSAQTLSSGIGDGNRLFLAAQNHMERVFNTLDIRVTQECKRRLEFGPESVFRFNVPDLLSPGVRVKKMGILDFADAQLLSLVARRELRKKTLPVSMEMFRLAGQAFDRVLQTHPEDIQAQREKRFVGDMVSALSFGPRSFNSALDFSAFFGLETVFDALYPSGNVQKRAVAAAAAHAARGHGAFDLDDQNMDTNKSKEAIRSREVPKMIIPKRRTLLRHTELDINLLCYWACYRSHNSILSRLLSMKADVNARFAHHDGKESKKKKKIKKREKE